MIYALPIQATSQITRLGSMTERGDSVEGDQCPQCEGHRGNWEEAICHACGGEGVDEDDSRHPTCPACEGNGTMRAFSVCSKCGGTGNVKARDDGAAS